jgi:hypothetical protein
MDSKDLQRQLEELGQEIKKLYESRKSLDDRKSVLLSRLISIRNGDVWPGPGCYECYYDNLDMYEPEIQRLLMQNDTDINNLKVVIELKEAEHRRLDEMARAGS